MRFNYVLVPLFFFCFFGFSQTIHYQELGEIKNLKIKATSYIASTNDTFTVGEKIYFDNYEHTSAKTSFLRENIGKSPVKYFRLRDLELKIYKVKLFEADSVNKVQLIVYDEETMLKYRLDVEEALSLSQLFLLQDKNKPKSTISLVALKESEVTSEADIAKEMLLMSAVELKKFNRGYNTSLILMTTGSFISLASPLIDDNYNQSIIRVTGGILFLAGAIKGVAARQHIGKSGAYLEAYANGVRIRF